MSLPKFDLAPPERAADRGGQTAIIQCGDREHGPDPAEEDPQGVVLDVETIQTLARGGGRLPLPFPKVPHMQEVLEGIKSGLYPLPEAIRQTTGIEHRTHVHEEERVSLDRIVEEKCEVQV